MIRRTLASFVALGCVASIAAPAVSATVVSPSDFCVGDANGDAEVTIDEILTTVNNALEGCDFVPIEIPFVALVGDEPFACGQSYDGLGTTGATVIPSDFRLYVHNIRLVDDRGQEVPVLLDQDGIWQFEDLVLLDFEDKQPPCNLGTVQTNTVVRGRVPRGNYDGLRFNLGVPFRLNHQDVATARSPLVLTAMFWGWQGGFKFLRVDDALDLVRVHLGSTGCSLTAPNVVDRCTWPNRGEAIFPRFDVERDIVAADLAALFADSDLSVNAPGTPPGCMSGQDDADCEPMLRNLGVNFANGLPDPSRQRFFRVLSGNP